jgi:two-component system alkaline phosphatase synthesis response regulator PhoP
MSARILVIEDDKFLRKACDVSLTKRGFEVLTAVDGEEGIRIAHEGSPDLILLDMLMPKMTGIETLEILKKDEKTHNIPVVILSNSSIEADVQKANALGAVGYLVKAALSLRELGDKVIGFLEEAGKDAG